MQRMTIYVPDDLHAAIVRHAESKGQKLSTWFVRAARAALLEELNLGPAMTHEELARLVTEREAEEVEYAGHEQPPADDEEHPW